MNIILSMRIVLHAAARAFIVHIAAALPGAGSRNRSLLFLHVLQSNNFPGPSIYEFYSELFSKAKQNSILVFHG